MPVHPPPRRRPGLRWPFASRLALASLAVLVVHGAGCRAGPPRAPCDASPEGRAPGTLCGFRQPEDVEAVPSAGLILVSQMGPLIGAGEPGSVAAFSPPGAAAPAAAPRLLWPPPGPAPGEAATGHDPVGDPSCTSPPDRATFSPHGIAATRLPPGADDTAGQRPASVVRVGVVAHGAREAIELFDLVGEGREARLAWRGCVPFPPGVAGNDLAFGPRGEIVAVNCLPRFGGPGGIWHSLRGNLGWNTGNVLVWTPGAGWRAVPDSDAAMPNGVAVSPDGEWIFVAETGARRLARLPHPDARHAGPPIRVDVPGNPDNLSWSSRGTLLLATHTGGSSFASCAFGQLPCRAPWALLEVDPATMSVRELFAHDGERIGAVSSATESGGRTYVGAVFDDRIGVLP